MSTSDLVTLTNNASSKIAMILSQQQGTQHFRIHIKGGGCSGFEYVFALDDSIGEQDFAQQVQHNDSFFMVLIDDISYQYVQAAIIDFKQDANGERFIVTNPNAGTSCSCGSSFSLAE